MESRKIFEESMDELARVEKQSTSAALLTINVGKLDSVTKGQMLDAIRQVCSQRTKDITRVLSGVQ